MQAAKSENDRDLHGDQYVPESLLLAASRANAFAQGAQVSARSAADAQRRQYAEAEARQRRDRRRQREDAQIEGRLTRHG